MMTLHIPDLGSPATYSLYLTEEDAEEIARMPHYRIKRISIPSICGVASLVGCQIHIQWPRPKGSPGFHTVTVSPGDYLDILAKQKEP